MTPNGLTVYPSRFGPAETMARLVAAVADLGMSVFARIDHAAGAAAVGMELRPTELLLFGNARAGTLLMQAVPSTAIDLPLKAVVWQDAQSATWLAFNDPAWVAARHDAASDAGPTLAAMTRAISVLASKATGADP